MCRIISLCLLVGCLVTGCEPKPERLTSDTAARSPEGWRGRRYMQNGQVISEEFDTTGSGRMDRWLYYGQGRLILEEFDENENGRINRRERHLENGHVQVEMDTNHDGRMDHWTQFNEKGVPVMSGVDQTGDGRVNAWVPMVGVSRREPEPTPYTPPATDPAQWQEVDPEPFPYVEERGFEQREFREPPLQPDTEYEDMSLPPYGESERPGLTQEPTWEDLEPILPEPEAIEGDAPVDPPAEAEAIAIPEETRTPAPLPAPPAPSPQPAPASRYPQRHPSEGLEE